MVEIGRMTKHAELQRVTRVPGPDGYTETWATYAWIKAAIEPATPRSVESLTSATITSPVSHLVTTPYLAGVVGADRVLFKERALYIAGIQNVRENDRWLVLACEERG
jgi:head-tail adaptor